MSQSRLTDRRCRARDYGSAMSTSSQSTGSAGPSRAPEPTVSRVLDDLGSTFLRPVAVPDPGRRVGGVIIHDPFDTQAFPDDAVVLAIAPLAEHGSALADELVAHRASAVVVREPVELSEQGLSAAADAGVAVLGLARGASWTQLSALLRSLLAEADVGVDQESIGGFPAGDLFTLANAIAALVDAPITIEDRSSRVLAFSGRQDEADDSRIETILERQVPERYSTLLSEAGFFKRLYSTDGAVHIQLQAAGDEAIKIRAAIAVRAGDEVLGSIWAAVTEELSPQRDAALRDAAKLVALHLLRVRAGADAERRLRADLLGTALEGGAGATQALSQLGLEHVDLVVFAAGLPGDAGTASLDELSERSVLRQRLSDAIAIHLAAVHPRSSVALLGDTIYGVLPTQRTDGEAGATRLARDFLSRIGPQTPVYVGLGPVSSGAADIAAGRASADRALRVLREQGGQTSRVALLSDVQVDALLLELRDHVAGRGERASGPLARLSEHDANNDSDLVNTLRAWLDTMGDIAAAADQLHIHPNTFRYRLRRLSEIADLDLTDPEARFGAMLQLRIMPELRHRPPGS